MQYLTAKVVCVSIHAPHEGERPYILPRCRHIRQFQSTLPTRGSDQALMYCEDGLAAGFNPRSPRGGATAVLFPPLPEQTVSIHAPHEGERPPPIIAKSTIRAFQSTLPTRGSDSIYHSLPHRKEGFNPRSPRGGATLYDIAPEIDAIVSIHAPHEGERLLRETFCAAAVGFNPRSPRGGATA